jgi:putative transcription antitermination factor YqgF
MTHYFLGLDWGKAKIGVALADEETRLAFGHAVLKNDARLFEVLKTLVKEYAVEKVVVGMPQHVSQVVAQEEIRAFGKKLEEDLEVQVFYFQEMFTTKMAQAHQLERGKMKDVDTDDKEAARIILQEWLDHQKS